MRLGTELARERMNRAAALGIGRRYSPRGGRANTLLRELREYIAGTVLDVGAGANALAFSREFGSAYQALDIGNSYKLNNDLERGALRHVADIEGKALPFADQSFDTVLCMDVLEHIDDTHRLLDELFRVSRCYVVVSLPNNWPGFFWSLLVGRNITHVAGYGLGPQPKEPGQRHKHFFNLEEGSSFLIGRAPADFEVARVEFRFEHGADGVLATMPGLTRFFRLAGKATPSDAAEHFGAAGPLVWLGAKLGYVPLRALDLALSAALFGWGDRARFYNLFCRQLWVVFRRKP
jgi:SAM-dependent methyltransferase